MPPEIDAVQRVGLDGEGQRAAFRIAARSVMLLGVLTGVLTVCGFAVGASLDGVTVSETVAKPDVSAPCATRNVKLSGPRNSTQACMSPSRRRC